MYTTASVLWVPYQPQRHKSIFPRFREEKTGFPEDDNDLAYKKKMVAPPMLITAPIT